MRARANGQVGGKSTAPAATAREPSASLAKAQGVRDAKSRSSDRSPDAKAHPPDSRAQPPTIKPRPLDAKTQPAEGLTIEQLAAEVGMSVRNIRNHQSRGLLPAPEVRARVGYYNAEHVARLRLILDLQADGFNLAAIERLMSSSGGVAERLLGLRRAMTTAFESEAPEVVTGEELARRFGEVDAKSLERIRKLRLLVALGDDRFEVPSPALMRAAEEVTALGISLQAAVVLVEKVSRDCESISRAFVKLFLRELWEPFEQAGQPEERWDEVIEAIDSLRSIASEALLAMFKQRMTAQVERAFGKVLEQQAKRSG